MNDEEVIGEAIALGEWGEELLIRSDGRHCLKGCNGDVVQLEPEQWDGVARYLRRQKRISRWDSFTDDEMSMITGLVRSGGRSRARIVHEYMHGPMAPMLREISKELRRRRALKPSDSS